jgi:hypothetical protein
LSEKRSYSAECERKALNNPAAGLIDSLKIVQGNDTIACYTQHVSESGSLDLRRKRDECWIANFSMTHDLDG